ncbi:MAG: thioredoxin family protein [Promethearchaeota archaeon]
MIKKKINILIGAPDNTCSDCLKTEKNVRKAIKKLEGREIIFDVNKFVITDPESIKKYGPLIPPALVFDDTLVVAGNVPRTDLIIRALKQYIEELNK